ncbi:MAG: bile acid:sodium symporter [Planctomycetota bacterium]
MANLAEQIRRHLIWLLLAAYAVAAVAPTPGVAIAQLNLTEGLGLAGRATPPLILVAVLFLLAAMAVEHHELRVLLLRPWVWVLGLACVWIGPAVAVAIAGRLMPGLLDGAALGLMLGMALVAAMPVANSSVAWTQQAGGSLPWSLGLVVLSILFTPFVTPPLLRLSGMSLAGEEAAFVEQIIRSFSGAPFVVWVLLPTGAGLLARRVMGAGAVAEIAPARHLASAVILLVLNYANGSVALPKFFEEPSVSVLFAATAAALGLALMGVALATALAVVFRLSHPTGDALRFALSMKHTGLAFALATTAGLADHPTAMLLIVVATPTQHLVAALVDRLASSRVAAVLESSDEPNGETDL